mmetsp:Transcript_5459/g.12077  ORF Transcript_5459/g.12077 Transcript_5459/m.12077 type:complete len:250 (+) Transcript_5459:222-971(+)
MLVIRLGSFIRCLTAFLKLLRPGPYPFDAVLAAGMPLHLILCLWVPVIRTSVDRYNLVRGLESLAFWHVMCRERHGWLTDMTSVRVVSHTVACRRNGGIEFRLVRLPLRGSSADHIADPCFPCDQSRFLLKDHRGDNGSPRLSHRRLHASSVADCPVTPAGPRWRRVRADLYRATHRTCIMRKLRGKMCRADGGHLLIDALLHWATMFHATLMVDGLDWASHIVHDGPIINLVVARKLTNIHGADIFDV